MVLFINTANIISNFCLFIQSQTLWGKEYWIFESKDCTSNINNWFHSKTGVNAEPGQSQLSSIKTFKASFGSIIVNQVSHIFITTTLSASPNLLLKDFKILILSVLQSCHSNT